MLEKKTISSIFSITLISICLLGVAAPVRGDLASGPAINQMGLVREQSSRHPQSAPRTVTYTYDDAGRLVLADYGEDRSIFYSYDDMGNLLSQAVVAPVTQEISPGGGALTYTDPQGNDTLVTVPPGAVSVPIDLTLTPLSVASHPAPAMEGFAGHAFGLEVSLGGVVQPGFGFLRPVTITIHYSDADVERIDENTLALDYWDGGGWVDAATTCAPISAYDRRPAENWLAVPVCHLSEFALFGEKENEIYLPLVFRDGE